MTGFSVGVLLLFKEVVKHSLWRNDIKWRGMGCGLQSKARERGWTWEGEGRGWLWKRRLQEFWRWRRRQKGWKLGRQEAWGSGGQEEEDTQCVHCCQGKKLNIEQHFIT